MKSFQSCFPFDSATYNVQDFALHLFQNDVVNATCYFARNSSADGCQIKLTSMESKETRSFNIIKISLTHDVATANVNIVPGEYDVSVHDIINNHANSNSSLKETFTFIIPFHLMSPSSSLSSSSSSSLSSSSGL